MSFFRFLGSVYFAAILIALLAILLAVSTWVESTYSTPFAQRLVYQAGWFDGFLLLIGLNILFSTLSRWPFKKKHTGFVLTHIGILFLLGGSLASRLMGVDGQLYVPEGRENDRIAIGEYELAVEGPHGEEKGAYSLGKKGAKSFDIELPENRIKVHIHRVADEVDLGEDIHEGASEDPENPALHVSLSSQAMGANIQSWLMKSHPFREDPRVATAGPATLQLLDDRPEDTTSPPTLTIKKEGQILLEWKTSEAQTPKAVLDGSNNEIKIMDFQYFPDAKVGAEGKLVNASENPVNPAVRFELLDKNGHKRQYLRFANFPDFESIHGRNEADPFGIAVDFTGGSKKIEGPSLIFFRENGEWFFQSRNRAGEIKSEGTARVGESYAAGWVDFQFKVETILNRAAVSRTVTQRSGAPQGPAAEISIETDGVVAKRDWLVSGEPFPVPLKGNIRLHLRQKHVHVPFSLKLLDFRKVDYPGSDQPASFESDVHLSDPKEKVEIKKTIRMNQPLDYAGYRIFQSSYVQNEGQEASIFTVAKNPGIFYIYLGSIVMFIGAFITFFIPSFSSFRH